MNSATPHKLSHESIGLLVQAIEAYGVELRVKDDGLLLLRDRDKRLSAADRRLIHDHAPQLADWRMTLCALESRRLVIAIDERPTTCPACDDGREPVYREGVGGALIYRCIACGRDW